MDRFHHYLLRLYNIHKTRNFRNFSDMGMSQGQPKVLELLLYNDGCSQKELAKLCELQPATMSALLKKMEGDDLVHRVKEKLSNRVHITRIFLTKKGREFADLILGSIIKIEEQCFIGFTEQEKETLLLNMKRIYSNLEE